jgi:hypothetical protein
MQYNAPYGVSDPNAPYVNGNPTIGLQGSIPPAAAFEYPQREIINLISGNKFTPSNSDLNQMLEATRSQSSNFLIDTGTVNTLSVACNPPLATYTPGLPLRIRVYATNTGDSTLDAGCGRVSVRRPDGSACQAGDLPAGGVMEVVYDGAHFQLINFLGGQAAGDIINNYNNIPYTVDVSTTPNIITANFSPPVTALVAGTIFMVKIANTCTADTVINVNAFTGQPIRANGAHLGGRLLPGDVQIGDVKIFRFDGTQFWIEPNPLISDAVTINVPSTQFPDLPTVRKLLARKSINSAAGSGGPGYANIVVTILLASGHYPPFVFSHPNGSHITIRGTMLAAAPGYGSFAQNGPSGAQRTADANANLAMLHTRYGTIIDVSNATGFMNVGAAGCPQIQDMLFQGDRSANSSGIFNDVSSPQGSSVELVNVAIWGMGAFGVFNGGQMRMANCSIDFCGQGACCESGGDISLYGTFIMGCDFAGIYCTIGSTATCQVQTTSNSNQYFGLYAGGNSMINISQGVVVSNGYYDAMAQYNSAIGFSSVQVNTFSPPINTIGNANSILYG